MLFRSPDFEAASGGFRSEADLHPPGVGAPANLRPLTRFGQQRDRLSVQANVSDRAAGAQLQEQGRGSGRGLDREQLAPGGFIKLKRRRRQVEHWGGGPVDRVMPDRRSLKALDLAAVGGERLTAPG